MSTNRDTLMVEARARARRAGVSPEAMALAMQADRAGQPYRVELEATTAGGSFFRVAQEGPTRVLYLNLDHPFYQTIYDPPGATRRYKDQIEIFLWVLGIAELEASDEDYGWYQQERLGWSGRLLHAVPILDGLLGYQDLRDRQALQDEGES